MRAEYESMRLAFCLLLEMNYIQTLKLMEFFHRQCMMHEHLDCLKLRCNLWKFRKNVLHDGKRNALNTGLHIISVMKT